MPMTRPHLTVELHFRYLHQQVHDHVLSFHGGQVEGKFSRIVHCIHTCPCFYQKFCTLNLAPERSLSSEEENREE